MIIVKINKEAAVIKAKLIVLLKDRKVDETTAGITSKITNGLVIPPVKKTSTAN